MAETNRDIPDHSQIPPTSREQFLPLMDDSAWPLRERGVLAAGISELMTPFAIGRASPTFHAALYTVAGGARFVTKAGEGTMGPGTLWVGPAGQAYRYEAGGGWRVCWFHLDVGPRWDALAARGVQQRPSAAIEALHAAMEGMVAEAIRRDSGADTAARAHAEIIGILLDREMGDGAGPEVRRTQQRLAALWEQVNGDLAVPWTVAALAARLCVSAVHLHRLSVRHQGLAPMAQVTRLRMRRAEAMLRSTDYTLGQIAAAVGYETPFALSRAFKRYHGESPSAFRGRRV